MLVVGGTVDEVFRRLPQNIFGGTRAGGANSSTDYTGGNELALQAFNGTANVTGASTVNLRGIGERGTLILVDGRRIGQSGMLGGFSDISSIPMAMVERVDILLDGASVIYGPDAIGGVVNIILRKDFKGIHVRVRHDAPTERGQSQQTASIATTYGWDRGSLTGTLNYFRTGALDLSDSNLDSVGTFDRFTPFGTVSGQGWPPPVAIRALTEAYGEPAYYASVPENSDGVLAVGDFLGTANNPLMDDNPRTGDDLIPARTDYNIRFDLRQELGAGLGRGAGRP
ncbi:MAG: TonB-dependent receptor plug domain-containing protein [Gammaproteobacteria bacterium]|nr:TonB-dependent receptor plug domain-containing protein [Gammaproteobacteria bacterium]